MNYYRRFPGDYLRDTAALTHAQHGVYNLLLDHLYSTEQRIQSIQEAYRIVHASTPRQKTNTEFVLDRFFFFVPGGWTNKRFEEELTRCNKIAYSRKLAALSMHQKAASAVQVHTNSRLHKKKEESPNIELSQDHANLPPEGGEEKPDVIFSSEENPTAIPSQAKPNGKSFEEQLREKRPQYFKD